MAQRDDRREEFVDVRIPAALAERIDDVYAECRGYEASSMQESLSVLCDLAAGRLRVPDETALDRVDRSVTDAATSELADGDASADAVVADLSEERRANVDAAFPTRWSADATVASRLAAVVDRYVRNPEGMPDPDAREADALHVVGEREGLAPDALRDRLVTALYGNTGLPDDLAGEFFSDALASVAEAAGDDDATDREAARLSTNDATDPGVSTVDGSDPTVSTVDVSESPIFDDGPPALTDGPPAAPAQPASGLDPEAAFDSPTDEVTVDSMLADEAAPTARCERCEAYHAVDDLETVIGSASSTIELLCESCAATVEEKD
ncbi:hypothetical protein G9C85_10090 [Halorubellus sp. JP-L1]|uniref:hypothetical protein n=1 Tax=Halorubellus sp. JP-L1 TaxID=2715753 RepID=UPI00140BBCC7|nr:hypothetical protein [Halorubellus sp. JP-L1]NHN41976.1 hypothetical protein [Halorubellus sp. JP-L1]